MEPNDMLYADPLDILFENRNKSYGAYPLRKFYAQRLYLSMGITLSVVGLSTFLYFNFRNNTGSRLVNPVPDLNFTVLDLTPPPKPPAPFVRQTVPRPPVSINADATLRIVPDKQVIHPVPEVEDLKDAMIDAKAAGDGADNGEMPDNGNSNLISSTLAAKQVDDEPQIRDRSEIMPEFPGGIEALKRYLSRNLRMPDTNSEPGSVVKVIARFVVGADGKVSNIEIIQAADNIYNDEVKRVILKMPDWKPGSQNHRNVAVYFNLPVNFVNAE
jgi:periplasmic protein TonB